MFCALVSTVVFVHGASGGKGLIYAHSLNDSLHNLSKHINKKYVVQTQHNTTQHKTETPKQWQNEEWRKKSQVHAEELSLGWSLER